ncbi:MAG: hypothetical protein ACPF9K_08835 [Neptuniibacter sp.]
MSVLELAAHALKQAEEMKKAAEQDDWKTVESIKDDHSETVNSIAIADIPENETAQLRQILIETKRLNLATEQLAVQHKASLVKDKQTLSKANKMQKALDAFK